MLRRRLGPKDPWESAVAETLSGMGLWWEYESVHLFYSDFWLRRSCAPDFWVPAHDLLVEVKSGTSGAHGGEAATALGFKWCVVRGDQGRTAIAARILSVLNGTTIRDEVADAEALFGPLQPTRALLGHGFVWPKGKVPKKRKVTPRKGRCAYSVGGAPGPSPLAQEIERVYGSTPAAERRAEAYPWERDYHTSGEEA